MRGAQALKVLRQVRLHDVGALVREQHDLAVERAEVRVEVGAPAAG
jgi:hypothetical protein